MSINLKQLIYSMGYNKELQEKLLFISDDPLWLEQLFYLIKDQSVKIEELEIQHNYKDHFKYISTGLENIVLNSARGIINTCTKKVTDFNRLGELEQVDAIVKILIKELNEVNSKLKDLEKFNCKVLQGNVQIPNIKINV